MVLNENTVGVILPVKSFALGKTRLRASLSDHARAALARELFLRTLHATLQCPRNFATYVVTNGDDVAELVHLTDTQQRAVVLRDPRSTPPMELAELMDWALEHVSTRAARALIVMADLPLIETRDLVGVYAALDANDCVLVPDKRGQSTNALGLRLPFPGRTAFGQPDSFTRHSEHARALGLRCTVLANGRIAHDVDIPEDLITDSAPFQSLDGSAGDVARKHQGW